MISKSKNGLGLFGKGLESGSNRLDWQIRLFIEYTQCGCMKMVVLKKSVFYASNLKPGCKYLVWYYSHKQHTSSTFQFCFLIFISDFFMLNFGINICLFHVRRYIILLQNSDICLCFVTFEGFSFAEQYWSFNFHAFACLTLSWSLGKMR